LPADVPFVGHTCVIAVERRSDPSVAAWYRDERAPRIVELDGVHGIMSLESATRAGLTLDMIFVEGDPVHQTEAVRAAVPHHEDVALVLDAPFSLIDPLRYGFAHAIRTSSLPATVA